MTICVCSKFCSNLVSCAVHRNEKSAVISNMKKQYRKQTLKLELFNVTFF